MLSAEDARKQKLAAAVFQYQTAIETAHAVYFAAPFVTHEKRAALLAAYTAAHDAAAVVYEAAVAAAEGSAS